MISLLATGFLKNHQINLTELQLGELKYLMEQACLLTLNQESYTVMEYSWNKVEEKDE